MAIQPVASAQIRVVCETDAGSYDLRLYSAEEFVGPQWWMGVSDRAGELRLTAVSPVEGRTPAAVRRWLETAVDPGVAGRLVRLVAEEVSRAISPRDGARSAG